MHRVEPMELYAKQAARARKGLSAAQSSENYQLVALNTRQLFKSLLMQGLISWRHGRDAVGFLISALDVLEESVVFLSDHQGSRLSDFDLPVERASFVAYLLGRPVDLAMFRLNKSAADRWLDSRLVSELYGESPSLGAPSDIGDLEGRSSLAARTYSTYFEILACSTKGLPVNDLVKIAEDNYRARRFDKFYSGADQTEGGGPDNASVVDYRLAAVLLKVGYVGDTIHQWRQ